jgi:hypothetical protein
MPAHVTAWPSAQSWFVPLRGGMTRPSEAAFMGLLVGMSE